MADDAPRFRSEPRTTAGGFEYHVQVPAKTETTAARRAAQADRDEPASKRDREPANKRAQAENKSAGGRPGAARRRTNSDDE